MWWTVSAASYPGEQVTTVHNETAADRISRYQGAVTQYVGVQDDDRSLDPVW